MSKTAVVFDLCYDVSPLRALLKSLTTSLMIVTEKVGGSYSL